jgi:hypothetical protein
VDKFLINKQLYLNLIIMKKVIAICSSLLFFAGLKAQTTQPPVVKKETVNPGTAQPGVITSTDKKAVQKQVSHKDIKMEHIKKTPTVQMKEAPVQMKEAPAAKPHKG